MYYYVNEIEQAIQQKRKLTFHYWEYKPNKQKVFRHGGELYSVSPYALMWKDDRYYMLGWNDARESVNTFRVDLMCDATATDEPAHEKPESFSLEHYGKSVSHMYDGEEREVLLLCKNQLMTKMFDKFGNDFDSWTVSDTHFIARVQTSISKTFYGWLFQYAGEIDLIGPEDLVHEYRARLNTARSCSEENEGKHFHMSERSVDPQ